MWGASRNSGVMRSLPAPTGRQLRAAGKLDHIGVGRQHAGTEVLILVQDLHIRIISKETGELLRELTLDPSRDYQPTGQPPGPKRRTP